MVARMVHGCKDPASESGLPRLAYFVTNSGDFGTKARKLLDRQHQAEEFRKQKRDQVLAWRELAT